MFVDRGTWKKLVWCTLENTVFEEDTVEVDHDGDNDEVTALNPFRPFSPPHDETLDVSPPWTPNLHPCQAPLFVSYNACRHDYTRSDERVCYDSSLSSSLPGLSPIKPCNPRNACSPGCFYPKRCMRHYPFTFGCNDCIEHGWHPPHHPGLNLTPGFIRMGHDHPKGVEGPAYAKCETGRYVPITRMYSPYPASFQQEWLDATPSSTSSSDVERHVEIRRQTLNTKASTSTSSMDLSAIFPEEVDRLVDEWSLRQIGRGNTDEEFLNADRNKRIEMMSMGRYESDEDPEELRRHRHPSEEDIEIYIYSSGDENGPWVPMPRAGEASASGALRPLRKSKNSRRSRPRRKTALPPLPPIRARNAAPTRGALESPADHTAATNTEDRLRLFSSFKENVANTPRASDNVSAQKIVTPYQETVETPPMIYSVVDNGKDFTEILKDMEIKAIKYTKLEAVLAGSSDVSMENRVKTAEEDYDGVVKRNDYLENMHHLFLSGIAARDALVTDYTNANDTNVPTPPPPSTGASLAGGKVTFVPLVKSAEDAARAIVDLRKEADRLIVEAYRLTEANEAAAETTALLIREAEKIVAAIESKMEEEPLTRISQGLKQAEALLQQNTPTREQNAEKARMVMINLPDPMVDGGERDAGAKTEAAKTVTRTVESEVVKSKAADPKAIDNRGHDEMFEGQAYSADLSEYFTPIEAPPKPANKVTLLEYKAPTPNINDESAERRLDADYVPSYSNLATSESDISAVTTMSEETRSKLRSGCLSGRSLDTVQRYSEGVIRRPSQRRASIHAKANIRDQLISDQDKKDASYNGGETRQGTPQVSPSIPLDPGTPVGGGGWQRPFIPTNELVLTRPVFHINGDNELDDMVKRFNSSATTSTASVIRAPLQDLQYGYRPARRSFLRPALKPIPASQSVYPPPHGLKTWRKFPESPVKRVQAIELPSEDTVEAGNGNDGANKVGRKQIVIEISSSPAPNSPTWTSSVEIQHIGTKSN